MQNIEFKLSEQGNAIYVCSDGEKVDRTHDVLAVVRDYLMDKMVDMNQAVGVRWTVDDIGSVVLALHVHTPDEYKPNTSAEPENKERARGRWVDDGFGSYIRVCSICGAKPRHNGDGKPLYYEPCPSCGARNDRGCL